jgi:hypothetical protein
VAAGAQGGPRTPNRAWSDGRECSTPLVAGPDPQAEGREREKLLCNLVDAAAGLAVARRPERATRKASLKC